MRTVFTIFILALATVSCSTKNSFTVSGTVKEQLGDVIYLNRVDVDVPVRIDSSKIKSNGTFKFRVDAVNPEFYQIGTSSSDFITILAEPGEKIKIEFNGLRLTDSVTVSGSPGTEKIMALDSSLSVTLKKIDLLKKEYEKEYGAPGFEETQSRLNEEFVKTLKEQRLFTMDFILKNLKSFAAIKALYQKIDENTYVLYDARDIQFLKLVSDTLARYYPGSKQVKSLKANFEAERKRLFVNQIGQLAANAPETKLDPSLKDINGKKVTLSDLRGKHVLLTFWSAASRDCLAENLELKTLYSKYRNKGFEIYQVNLDSDEEAWKKAVRFDELPWISVREDDPLNPKTAVLYNVRVLPANYLYDNKGNIIANNLHGKQLQIKLSQIFGN
jgi:cytochrome oxidase Cu insertion factor (SCO1/SenC/PrrC family)